MRAKKPATPLHSGDRVTLLRNHPLFRSLPESVIEHLASYLTRKTVKRGTQIFAKGDPGNGLMAVLAGNVKISVLSPDGREVVLNIIHPGEIFGEIALLDGRPRTADATAMSDCELAQIDRRDFVPFLRSQPDVVMKFIDILCLRLRHTSEHVEELMFLELPARLAKTLIRLTGEAAEAGGTRADRRIEITQREIGQMIGMSRESTNRQLRAWAKRKWIRIERGGITVLDQRALAEQAQDTGRDVA
jgi:CRP-like cAMP-binding protein